MVQERYHTWRRAVLFHKLLFVTSKHDYKTLTMDAKVVKAVSYNGCPSQCSMTLTHGVKWLHSILLQPPVSHQSTNTLSEAQFIEANLCIISTMKQIMPSLYIDVTTNWLKFHNNSVLVQTHERPLTLKLT